MYSSEVNKEICRSRIEFLLTNKEKNILKLIAQGKDNKDIAKLLYYSEGSVRNTVSEILQKLYLRDRTQLAIFAWKNRIVD